MQLNALPTYRLDPVTMGCGWGGRNLIKHFVIVLDQLKKIRIWILEQIKVLYQSNFMKLTTVLCNNISILRKYTLKCLGIKGHDAYNVLSNGSEKMTVHT